MSTGFLKFHNFVSHHNDWCCLKPESVPLLRAVEAVVPQLVQLIPEKSKNQKSQASTNHNKDLMTFQLNFTSGCWQTSQCLPFLSPPNALSPNSKSGHTRQHGREWGRCGRQQCLISWFLHFSSDVLQWFLSQEESTLWRMAMVEGPCPGFSLKNWYFSPMSSCSRS